MKAEWGRPVLFFDGVCNLCDRSVRFMIRHDRRKRFLFASLQSAAGKKASREAVAAGGKRTDSMILYYDGSYYQGSAAALKAVSMLGGAWKLFQAALWIPPFIRDGVYDLVSRNRYGWFGRKDKCMIPAADLRNRFITGDIFADNSSPTVNFEK